MNTNFAHNLLNVIGLIVGSIMLYDWTAFGLDASTAAAVSSGLLVADKLIKLGINITRDGVTGLVKRQPPVQK